jgi:hypothetical protein
MLTLNTNIFLDFSITSWPIYHVLFYPIIRRTSSSAKTITKSFSATMKIIIMLSCIPYATGGWAIPRDTPGQDIDTLFWVSPTSCLPSTIFTGNGPESDTCQAAYRTLSKCHIGLQIFHTLSHHFMLFSREATQGRTAAYPTLHSANMAL